MMEFEIFIEYALKILGAKELDGKVKGGGETSIDLSGSQITDVTPLTELTSLLYLSLGWNQIADITPLAELTKLEKLDLHDNQITDVTPLAGLTELKDLWLSSNQITDVTPLAGLIKLEKLSLGVWAPPWSDFFEFNRSFCHAGYLLRQEDPQQPKD